MATATGSVEMNIRFEAQAMLGGPDRAAEYPAVYRWLTRVHIPNARAARRAEEDAARSRREVRWAGIAAENGHTISRPAADTADDFDFVDDLDFVLTDVAA